MTLFVHCFFSRYSSLPSDKNKKKTKRILTPPPPPFSLPSLIHAKLKQNI
jgi:hypothetical protein